MKAVKFLYVCFLLAVYNVIAKGKNNVFQPSSLKTDTLSGYFCYEINVPDLCYTTFQINQAPSIVFWNEEFSNMTINKIYRKGVISLGYDGFVENSKYKMGLDQYKSAINKFHKDIYRYTRLADSDSRLIKDRSGYLTFKKFHARIIVKYLGKLDVLIPDTKHFRPPSSSKKKSTKVYFVTDILDYQIE
jgi:hypothetical protein